MKRLILTICLCVLFTASTALADWEPGDPYKMHFPQLPDPDGWDVFAGTNYLDYTQKVLADDWQCNETGPVEDIHLWGSWREDQIGEIMSIYVSIHDDVPVDDPDNTLGYSHPGNLLWGWEFMDYEFTVRDYGSGLQGWYNPNPPEEVVPIDHLSFHQINIENISDLTSAYGYEPFIQQEGEIYWLDITVFTYDPLFTEWGWKTSQDHFMDDAVWIDATGPLDIGAAWTDWNELIDPYTGESLDLAFVITPEPATICLLGFGALSLLRKKRRA